MYLNDTETVSIAQDPFRFQDKRFGNKHVGFFEYCVGFFRLGYNHHRSINGQ